MKNDENIYLLGIVAVAILLFRKQIFAPVTPFAEDITGRSNSLGDKSKPVSIRNNNPGNIIKSKTPWKGKINGIPEGTDPRFEAFKEMHYGIRAMILNLKSYYNKHNLRTIRAIINKWAPPTENDTAAYINKVSLQSGILADLPFEWNRENVSAIARAMADVESGIKNTITSQMFDKAWSDT